MNDLAYFPGPGGFDPYQQLHYAARRTNVTPKPAVQQRQVNHNVRKPPPQHRPTPMDSPPQPKPTPMDSPPQPVQTRSIYQQLTNRSVSGSSYSSGKFKRNHKFRAIQKVHLVPRAT